MKLINSSVEILEQLPGVDGIYEQIELAGRTCYKSEDKITEDSAKEFVDRMIKSGHGAMLEHGTVYLTVFNVIENSELIDKYKSNKYSVVKEGTEVYNCHGDILYGSCKCITTNYRVLVENNWLNDLQYICEPTEYHEKRVTVKWTCDRVTGESFLRHRVFSFARESTRYCNYSKDKFGNEVTFIIPCWLNLIEGNYKWEDQNPLLTAGMSIEEAGYDDASNLWIKESDSDYYNEYKRHYDNWIETETFMHSLQVAEDDYLTLINQGWKPQQARQVLPFAVHSPLVMTGFLSDWIHFFELRCAPSAHPDAQKLAKELLIKLHKVYPGKFDELYSKYIENGIGNKTD